VVLFHYSEGLGYIPGFTFVAARGWIGVDLFFVMSGFLIGGIVLANKDATNFFAVFYVRRFLRIFPLYYLILLAIAALMAVGFLPATEHGLGYYFLYVQNIVMAFTGEHGPT
jgi:peptidoglycan/LPS O-acetylase OafA/YrhL